MTQEVQNVRQLEARTVLAWTEFRQLARRTVQEAWGCGRLLHDLKHTLDHGEWLPWLDDHQVPARTAQRLVRLYLAYPGGLEGEHTSIGDALRQLPKPEPKPEPPTGGGPAEIEPKLSKEERWLAERDKLVRENRELKEEVQEQSSEITELRQTADHLQSELKVGDGFARGRDVVEERQAEIRRLKAVIVDLEGENKELLRENQYLKRQLKRAQRNGNRERQPEVRRAPVDGGGVPF